MQDWSSGYVADVGYTYGYFTDLNPLKAAWALALAGYEPPTELGPGPLTACELGFGQGLSINIHAAAASTRWWGTDFNPEQAAFAAALNHASGAGAVIRDDAFEEFFARDLPEFDMIGLHGIWSWISDANRAAILRFVTRRLKVGGMLVISYNSQPGWGASMPLRHLLTQFAKAAQQGAGTTARIEEALQRAKEFFATQPRYAQVNEVAARRLENLLTQDRRYLAHEYFNADWHPFHFAQVAEDLAGAKLRFAASNNLLDHVDSINLSEQHRKFLHEAQDTVVRETLRDFAVNQQFRRDIWVKGARRLAPLNHSELLRKQRVVLVRPRQGLPLTVKGALGEASLNPAVYEQVLDQVADHKPRTFHTLEQALAPKGITATQLKEALTVLTGLEYLQPAQDERAAGKARATSDRLNQWIVQQARATNDVQYLASPVTGGGIGVSRFDQLFMAARQRGMKTADEWVAAAWEVLAAQGQRIIKDGKTLQSVEENTEELRRQARVFADTTLPVLQALGIA